MFGASFFAGAYFGGLEAEPPSPPRSLLKGLAGLTSPTGRMGITNPTQSRGG